MHEAKLAALSEYALRLKAFNALFKPQPVQLEPLKALFNKDAKKIFVRYGRQTGKSYMLAAMAVRWALLNPDSMVFLVGPTSLQMRQIYLHSGLLQKLIPREYLESVHTTDARFKIRGGGTIRLYGADNQEALRGITASLYLVDELKDLSSELIEQIIKPSLLVHNAPLVLSGTPPGLATHFYWDYVKEAEETDAWLAFRATSYDNIYTPPGSVEAEKQLHIARGTYDRFAREYLAEFYPDSQNSVFPMFHRDRHVRPYEEIRAEILKAPGHYRFVVALDPGSRFACVLMAINEYTKQVYVYDLVFERGQLETSIGRIVPRIRARLRELIPQQYLDDAPIWVADEAALWARNEILDRFDINVWPSRKQQNQKMDGLSLMKDLMLLDKIKFSDRCEGFIKQIEGYSLGPDGRPVKREDDTIDAFRYGLGVINYTTIEDTEPVPKAELTPGQQDLPRRYYTPEQDFPEHPLLLNRRLDDELVLDGDDW